MLDWSLINDALRHGLVEEITYSEGGDGRTVAVKFRQERREMAPVLLEDPSDPTGPAFRAAKNHLQALYSHTGAPVSDDDVLNYLRAQGLA